MPSRQPDRCFLRPLQTGVQQSKCLCNVGCPLLSCNLLKVDVVPAVVKEPCYHESAAPSGHNPPSSSLLHDLSFQYHGSHSITPAGSILFVTRETLWICLYLRLRFCLTLCLCLCLCFCLCLLVWSGLVCSLCGHGRMVSCTPHICNM